MVFSVLLPIRWLVSLRRWQKMPGWPRAFILCWPPMHLRVRTKMGFGTWALFMAKRLDFSPASILCLLCLLPHLGFVSASVWILTRAVASCFQRWFLSHAISMVFDPWLYHTCHPGYFLRGRRHKRWALIPKAHVPPPSYKWYLQSVVCFFKIMFNFKKEYLISLEDVEDTEQQMEKMKVNPNSTPQR